MQRDKETDMQSVTYLADLLRSIVAGVRTDQCMALRSFLGSQASLAAYQSQCGAVVSMSLNHQKRIAILALGSYEVLNRLRLEAFQELKRAASANLPRKRVSRIDLERRYKDVKRECQVLREDLFLLQRAYDKRCRQARLYAAKAGKATETLCLKEQSELDTGLSLRWTPPVKDNVIRLAGD